MQETLDVPGFQQKVLAFYKEKGRDFPWRHTKDPYEITVSEFMLQQTRTEGVLKKYSLFLQAFPSAYDLAEASLKDLLFLWKGLGYNRRALYLQNFARTLAYTWEGELPKDPSVLEQCQGIGPYTARAILTFTFNLPLVFLETNIRRVYLYHFFPQGSDIRDKDLLPLVEKTLYQEDPRGWYYALMDYGAYIGKEVPNPNRRSKHFTKQSPFEGSYRQLRGKILSVLLASASGISLNDLNSRLTFSPEKTSRALRDLVKEGFVAEKEGKYHIRD
ncbi:MAG: A/G-specific adenine glycosylase [Spirochaetales bacterium]